MDKLAGTATATSEFSSAVQELSLSLGERVGVRGKEASSNPGARQFPELTNFASPFPAEPAVLQFDYEKIRRLICGPLFFAR